MKIKQVSLNSEHSYSPVGLDSLEIGQKLGFNIFIKRDKHYVIIIEVGTVLTEELYAKLTKQDQIYISEIEKNKHELTCITLLTYIKYYKDDLQESLRLLYQINNKLFESFFDSKENIIDKACIERIVKSTIYLIQHNPHYLRETMPYFSSEYTVAYHSLHVSIYAISIAHVLELNEKQLLEVGMAGLLHDIGLKKVNHTIVEKNLKLDIKELEMIHKHTIYSAELAQKNKVTNQYILDAIMHHHEALDGTGYPDRLKGNKILDYASILSISDVFDALTNDRPYREKHSTFNALKIMMRDPSMIHKFNQKFLNEFLHSFLR